MKKKNIFTVFAVFLALAVIIGCDAQTPTQKQPPEKIVPKGTGQVTLVIDEEKSLTGDTNRDIMYWEFMATPKFDMPDNERLFGKVSKWRVLDALDTEMVGAPKTTCDLGVYTSGNWYFELRALNGNKHVLYVGSTEQVIREGLDNTVHITMLMDRADGTHGESKDITSQTTGRQNSNEEGTKTIDRYGQVHIGFLMNKLDLAPENLDIKVSYRRVAKSGAWGNPVPVDGLVWTRREAGEAYTKWFKEATTYNYREINGDSTDIVEEGKTYFETLIPDLDAGPYVFTVQFLAKNTSNTMLPIAGQVVDVTVVGNEEAQIKGTLLPNEYVKSDFNIDELGKIFGSVNGTNTITVDSEKKGQLKWQQTQEQIEKSKETAVKYYWISNGDIVLESNNAEVEIACPVDISTGRKAYGIHRITCVAIGNQGSFGCASIDVIFNPPEGPGNVDEFPWPDGMGPKPAPAL